ncbi:MscL family protein [Candidatus Dojkabacteria bacterium]|nr:MscL family protein [Candidatus Dojkabacteria bacterium]
MKQEIKQKESPVVKEKEKPRFGVRDFIEFLKNTKTIIAFSIAIISGNAVNELVSALVNGIITPAIELIIPKGEFETITVKIAESEFLIGQLISAAINLFIILVLIYIFAKFVSKDDDLLNQAVVKKAKATVKKTK